MPLFFCDNTQQKHVRIFTNKTNYAIIWNATQLNSSNYGRTVVLGKNAGSFLAFSYSLSKVVSQQSESRVFRRAALAVRFFIFWGKIFP